MQDIVWIVVGVRECRFVGIIDEADVAKAATNTTVVLFRVVSRSKPVPPVDRRTQATKFVLWGAFGAREGGFGGGGGCI